MDKQDVLVVIPIYKTLPDSSELASFKQCLKVLKDYDICLETYESLDLTIYESLSREIRKGFIVTYFEKKYFESIVTYNDLLMSAIFYERFSKYKYILIYHLDAWVFEDNLLEWCLKGYDYISAPWFKWSERQKDWIPELSGEVGNGGLSLRKVNTFINAFYSKRYLFQIKTILRDLEKNPISWIKGIAKMFGYHNNMKWYIHLCKKANMNEAIFWCLSLKKN